MIPNQNHQDYLENKDVVLAYSGGLDTTFCAVYLSRVLKMKVHAVTINSGGFSTQEIEAIRTRAKSLGIASFTCIDVKKEYYGECIKYLVYGNVLKNAAYPLSVSAERVIQARTIARYAKKINAGFIAHGSTGAGNDQVRFDMMFRHVLPQVHILTPIRDLQLSRDQEIEMLREQGVEIDTQKAAYSINKGLWGTSVGGRETLTSSSALPETAWPTPVTKTFPEKHVLHFTNGELTAVDNLDFAHPVEAIEYLHRIAQPFGIGRDIHVGDTIIGIKGRVGFEAAAPLIIIKAHHLLEKHVLTKWQLYWKDQLAAWYGNWLHEGQFMDPVMRDIESFMSSTQKYVNGKVFVTLSVKQFHLDGIESDHDLMSPLFGSYGEMNNGWTGEDVKGFTKIFGNQTSIFHQVNQTN